MSNEFLPFCRPCLDQSDIEAVNDVLRSNWITTGPKGLELESYLSDMLGGRHVVAVSSATAGIDLYLKLLNVGPGDEVITPSLTWVSVPNLVSLRGASPVFVDVDRNNLMAVAADIEAAITDRTRLIVPVHYAGVPLDLDSIYAVANKYNIPVLEDAAHALGTRYKGNYVGSSHGDSIFSLQAIKNVTAAEGGLFVSANKETADTIRQLRFHGLGVDTYGRETQGRSPQAQVLTPGYKYNLPDMNAALALNQLRRLEAINEKRRVLAEHYLNGLSTISELSPLSFPDYSYSHAWHLFIVRLTDRCSISRETFIERMKVSGLGVGIHFHAVHLQHHYRNLPENQALSLPNTEWNSQRICSLPLFPDMQTSDVDRVLETIKSIL